MRNKKLIGIAVAMLKTAGSMVLFAALIKNI